ncbi:MAG: RecX family transcriptional regulator [Candidatus Coproplasma sp.]
MSQITSIEQQQKDKTRCSVYLDGRFYCGLKIEVAIKHRLKPGMTIEKSELDSIQLDNEKVQAMEKAMNHLSATMKTEKQMRDFLAKKGYTQAVVDYIMEKLAYYGYVDDAAYCKAYVNSVKGKGKRAIESALISRGARKEAIDEALSEASEDSEEIFEILQKYLRGKEQNKQTYMKAFRYLMSKGYEYDAVKSAMERLGDDDEF